MFKYILILSAALCSTAYADLRCGNNLAREGDDINKVATICGQPDNSRGTVLGVDSITYTNYNNNGMDYTFTVGNDGKVSNIEMSPSN